MPALTLVGNEHEPGVGRVLRLLAGRQHVPERGHDAVSGQVLIEIDPRYFRPTEVDLLIGDASKARQKLGWHHKVSFAQLVEEMVAPDLKAVRNERARRDRRE